MAHYSFLDADNRVTHVIPGVDEWDQIEGKTPEEWYGEFVGQPCKRTSYNTHGGVNILGGEPYRLNYAGVGYEYRQDIDGFIPPQPYPSWILNESTGLWETPVPYPDDDGMYAWDEDSQAWVEAT
jgi:hypothetical protein